MNYIKSLQEQVNDLKTDKDNTKQEIQEFLEHLAGPKFSGVDLDGSRKDWISTNDVRQKLLNILDKLN